MANTTHTELPKTLFPFIWYFLREHQTIGYIVVILSTLAGFWGPFNSVLIKQLIDLLPNANDGNLTILALPAALIVINFLVFDNFTWRSINYIWAKYVPVIQNKIVAVMLDHALSLPQNFYQNNLSGKISKQITNLSDAIVEIITSLIANFLRGTALLLAAFAASYYVNAIFCLILIIWFIIFATISIYMAKKIVILADNLAEVETGICGELVDTLSNHSNVRFFGRKFYETERMMPFFERQRKRYYSLNIYSIILYAIQGALIAIMMGFSVFMLIHLYGKDLVTVGDFALILGLCIETGHMTWYLMSEVEHFNKAAGKCKQSLKSLIVPLEIQDKLDAVPLQCDRGQIIFDNVKFHYKDNEPLFQNKSISIQAGQKVGLVGYSGGGKSTFINLILRLYDVTDGAIFIDGHDIRHVTQDSLRENIAMIPQDPSLFHRSLMENIRYGRTDASDEEVLIAAEKAHAHGFIAALPQGYETLVGERGVKLSGGQRQRIAIARAILKNAPILILDEATSQLDSVTENLIQESLWELMQNKTSIVIAHRLSTLLHMERILVFDKGQIIEDGTHSDLLAEGGLYKQLWDAQVGGFLGYTT
ncbi:MAG: ABC transporter ATP-binding protein, partial [Alphaproteobacteria bacterium]|nr:ABC transporter ATP-binding protein [Alphaproteobacteria bacterium]